MYALIDGQQRVVNIVAWDGESPWEPPPGHQAVPVPPGIPVLIGWVCNAGTFVAPEVPAVNAPVPTSVTMRQARLALLAAGRLHDVDIAIAALPSPDREQAQIEWEFATHVERSSTLLVRLAAALDLELDHIFAAAAAL